MTLAFPSSVSFKRFRKRASTKIEAAQNAFQVYDFEIDIGLMTTTFRVSSPPREIDGVWKMTGDGVTLTGERRRRDRSDLSTILCGPTLPAYP